MRFFAIRREVEGPTFHYSVCLLNSFNICGLNGIALKRPSAGCAWLVKGFLKPAQAVAGERKAANGCHGKGIQTKPWAV